ncbi:phage holin [Paenarthrobacter nitroguajacolicus]|uniref:phage holin n=1 Tax=Paenarthrobacter nitroguajacolicus TaxID=211146 RepID=UPI00248D282A|nr:hypothetical protein [Paenarthrobacter nitroguajacolicus]MDI2033008.1 hypothetical protein [Paenarthrobacter nitroguajacolicus]
MIIKDPAVRAWIYGILGAGAAVAVTYGLLSGEQVTVWLALAAAVLGNGLALANTDKPGKHEAE